MNCHNCGNFNNEGSKFCIKCGNSLETSTINVETPVEVAPSPVQSTIDTYQKPLEQNTNVNQQVQKTTNETILQEVASQTVNNTSIENQNNFQTNVPQTINNQTNNNAPANKVTFMGYFFIILAIILKPFTVFKEELNKFNVFKNSAVISLIVSGVATLINLITSMLSVVRVKSFNWSSGGYTTTWTWENLKKLDYLEVIGKNFLIYLGIIVVIAFVYYIASLIVKKQINFSRLLGISALAVAPMLICSLILSPLLSMVWAELAMPITLIGAVYTIVILYEGMNEELKLQGNAKYYFNLVCLSILGIAAYYLYMKLFVSSITNGLDGLDDLMNMFG